MDRNAITGLVIILAILVGFSLFNAPSEAELAEQKMKDSVARAERDQQVEQLALDEARKDSLAKVEQFQIEQAAIQDSLRLDSLIRSNPAAADSLRRQQEMEARIRQEMRTKEATDKYGSFYTASAGDDNDVVIENDHMVVTISSKGGRISSVKLKNYQTYSDSDLYLMHPETSQFGLIFSEGQANYSTNDLYFTPSGKGFKVSESDSNSVSFKLAAADNPNKYLEYSYGLTGDGHHVYMNIKASGLDNVFDPNDPRFRLKWYLESPHKEKNLLAQKRASTVMYKYFDEKRDYIWESSEDSVVMEQPTWWVDFKQHFFSAIVVHEKGFRANASKVSTKQFESNKYVMGYGADLTFDAVNNGTTKNGQLQFYFGPNHFHTLEQYGRDYEEVIDYGWGIFGLVNRWITIPIFNLLEGWGLNYGIIILIITIFIKMLLLPITYKTYLSSAKMRVLKPEVEAINKKFPDKKDAMKKQQAMMSLYRQTGVNPLAGCIPMIIQMPILYAMFRFFPSSIELRGESFLWADDLSAYDSVWDFGFEIPLYGDHLSLFTLMMAASTIFYTRMNSTNMSMGNQQGMPNMKVMMYLFPIMMLFFFNNYSAALSYYYFLANTISILQMWFVKNYLISEDKIRAKIETNKKKPKKKSKFAERLEEIQRQQRTARGGK